jgi:SNF2 family DNA or RNA helicase
MFVLHAVWTGHALNFWAESELRATNAFADQTAMVHPEPDVEPDDGESAVEPAAEGAVTATAAPPREILDHAFTMAPDVLRTALIDAGILTEGDLLETTEAVMQLPHRAVKDTMIPEPSERLASKMRWSLDSEGLALQPTTIPTIPVRNDRVAGILLRIEDRIQQAPFTVGHDVQFWFEAGRLVLDLLEHQRFIPTMAQERDGALRANWLPWLNDRETSARAAQLLASMPAVACAVEDHNGSDPWNIFDEAIRTISDETVRAILVDDDYPDALDGRDLIADTHAGWLDGLFNTSTEIPVRHGGEMPMLRAARMWIAHLDDGGASRVVRLCLQLSEPDVELEDAAAARSTWRLSFHLITADDPPIMIDADRIWNPDTAGDQMLSRIGGERESAEDVLLAELARAARVWPRLEEALSSSSPTDIDLALEDAYEFLREIRPILAESGVEVLIPSWWGRSQSRLAARLLIESDPLESDSGGTWGSGPARHGDLGLHSLVNYSWQISLGEKPVTLDEFRELAARGTPLVRVDGQWVEIRAEDVEGAAEFVNAHPGGEMSVLEAMRIANGVDGSENALPVLGMKATGWVAQVFGDVELDERLLAVKQPELFRGELRPYQLMGLSWLSFLDRFGLGACLADDMGLGKTIQLIALLQHERQNAEDPSVIGPTLLVVPMSVLGNWRREFNRFAPEIRVHLQHGLGRPSGDEFKKIVSESDVIITTYSLVTRDREMLEEIEWWRVTLDEAQHIKNPPTKQTAAIRAMKSRHRIALTGTPVENRLTELWSIMEFCCPGYLGTSGDFRRRFALPIERHRDEQQSKRLRVLVQPFILRRLKTDKNVISDLPPLVETKQTVTMTTEQAQLYDAVVEEMLRKVDTAEGIRRRGLVLASLVKLKQICNHPAHYLNSIGADAGEPTPERSGKSTRLAEMLEEVIANGDHALIFSQYRQMGHLLVSMIRHEFDVDPLFLHGGTPQARRDQLVDRFQTKDPATPIFILSLKAGGVGLNLTAANHVFHYDRWWNPAVENQATDRAFRIGQNRTVNVNKMISVGTLEERVDQMIEQKTRLAEQIIGAGESWVTELSTEKLRDLLSLRHSDLEEGIES